MYRIKRLGFVLIVGFIVLWMNRGWIYRHTITYKIIGERKGYELTDQRLRSAMDQELTVLELPLDDLIDISLHRTHRELSFAFEAASQNPNQILQKGTTHCIGYAALFHSIASHIITKQKMSGYYRSRHLVGEIYFLGINLHQFIDHPFFQNHDFNVLENLYTGEKIYVDPSMSDYLGIKRVSVRS